MENITQASIIKVCGKEQRTVNDSLVVEEPLEIRLAFKRDGSLFHKSISVTMRTPGDDQNLALGFLFTEGILHSYEQVSNVTSGIVRHKEARKNVLVVHLKEGVSLNLQKLERHFYTTSSCGVCGKASIEAVRIQSKYELPENKPVFEAMLIQSLPEKVLTNQSVFGITGGLHAAALINTSGNIFSVKEDVGRHNAVDKIIGEALTKNKLPLAEFAIMVSGRAGFEIVQKLSVAGVPVIIAIGAPTNLAIQLAEESGMTLIGFVRNQSFNIYTCPERIRLCQ
jgi:FdhD protein